MNVTLLDLLSDLELQKNWQAEDGLCVLPLKTETSSGKSLRWVLVIPKTEKEEELRLEQYDEVNRRWQPYEHCVWLANGLPEPVVEKIEDTRHKVMYTIANRQVTDLNRDVFTGGNFSY